MTVTSFLHSTTTVDASRLRSKRSLCSRQGVVDGLVNSEVVPTTIVDSGLHAVGYVCESDLVLGVERHLLTTVAGVSDDEVGLKNFPFNS